MRKISDLRKNFKEIPPRNLLKRLRDQRPLHANLYVTERCNLSCAYCTEFDNSLPHPDLDDLKRRIDVLVELGVLKLALTGGEPLLHPEIDGVIGHAKSHDLNVSLTTNGRLLDEAMLSRLESVGLDLIQISIDRKSPSPTSQKALDNLALSLETIRNSRIKIHISGVICQDTVTEAEEVLNFGLSHDIPSEFRLMHGNLSGNTLTAPAFPQDAMRLLEHQIQMKSQGIKVHSPALLLSYQKSKLLGHDISWKCLAGYKVFFVSAQGYFWPCPLMPTNRRIEDITVQDLKAFDGVKECQPHCGIYCVISNSLFMQAPARFIGRELPSVLRQNIRIFRKRRSQSL